MFRMDILKYPTLPSLAFAIFIHNYLGDSKIPIIDRSLFYDFKRGYTGVLWIFINIKVKIFIDMILN